MIMTMLEGRVTPDNWETLKQAFHAANLQLPPAIDQSYLLQDSTERDIWRIITLWHSYEALQQYRASVDTPGGILMFRAAGAEPTLSMFDIVDHAQSQ